MYSKRHPTKPRSTSRLCDILKPDDPVKSYSSTSKPSDNNDKVNTTTEHGEVRTTVVPEMTEPSLQSDIPEVLRKQSTNTNCSSGLDNDCPCNTFEAVEQMSKQISFSDRRNWISVERLSELRKKAQDAVKAHRVFTIRGCFFSVRNALAARGWVEKLDVHRKFGPTGMSLVTYEDLAQNLPKRRPGESRRQYLIKCERNIMSRFLEHVPIDFLWTARKEKCDWIDQAKNPAMIINRFHRAPFTSKEGLCSQIRDFHWFFEEGVSEMFFPRCYNVWSPEELSEFTENFRMTACISFLKHIVQGYRASDSNVVFVETAKVPFSAVDFALKRCNEFLDVCNHNDIDNEDSIRIWEHDWDAFLTNHYLITHEQCRIQVDPRRSVENVVKCAEKILEGIKLFWPQYNLDGCLNIWIVKPANKCRGRGIHLMNNVKKILSVVNPPIASKSRYVVQKYLERPLIIHNTKFDIRQWFLVTSVQPLVIWMYKESYLRFSSQEYNLLNYHESIHLTNHAVQKKYRNAKRDDRLPTENMWDCYTFQAYLREIGQFDMWAERIYPGMQHAIIGAMLASQDNMDRRINNFELFGADFMICEDFYPWLIEINSSPDLGATTSVTARMCPQCLEDTIKVIVDRKTDANADTGNFEMIYRQSIPPVPAYMGLNLFLKGKQVLPKITNGKKERVTGPVGSVVSTYIYKGVIASHSNPNLIPMPTYRPNFEIDAERTEAIKKPTIIADLLDNLLPIQAKRALTEGSFRPIGNKSPFTSALVPNGILSRCATSPALRTDTATTPSTPFIRPCTQNSLSALNATLLEKKYHLKSDELRCPQLSKYSKRYFTYGPRIQITSASDEIINTSCDIGKPRDKSDNSQESYLSPKQRLAVGSTIAKQSRSALGHLYKPKSANTELHLQGAGKKKSSRLNVSSACSKSNPPSSSVRKQSFSAGSTENITIVSKLTPTKTQMKDYTSSPFYAVGMSLRAWKSRQHKSKKTSTNSTNLRHKKTAASVTTKRKQSKLQEGENTVPQ